MTLHKCPKCNGKGFITLEELISERIKEVDEGKVMPIKQARMRVFGFRLGGTTNESDR